MRKRERTCLEAEEAALIRARSRVLVKFCAKAHVEHKVLSGTGLKIQVREGKLKPPQNLDHLIHLCLWHGILIFSCNENYISHT